MVVADHFDCLLAHESWTPGWINGCLPWDVGSRLLDFFSHGFLWCSIWAILLQRCPPTDFINILFVISVNEESFSLLIYIVATMTSGLLLTPWFQSLTFCIIVVLRSSYTIWPAIFQIHCCVAFNILKDVSVWKKYLLKYLLDPQKILNLEWKSFCHFFNGERVIFVKATPRGEYPRGQLDFPTTYLHAKQFRGYSCPSFFWSLLSTSPSDKARNAEVNNTFSAPWYAGSALRYLPQVQPRWLAIFPCAADFPQTLRRHDGKESTAELRQEVLQVGRSLKEIATHS